jgi:multidrug efflux pump subunit AcrA (membrane-fusion protein)
VAAKSTGYRAPAPPWRSMIETANGGVRLIVLSMQTALGSAERSPTADPTSIVDRPRTMMSRPGNRLWRIAAPLLIAALALYYYFARDGAAGAKYLTTAVSRGAIMRSVIATGTVNPVTVVQVGSYVSGPITSIYADFNAPVKAGQLIAKIDPRPFQVKVEESAAAVANAQAQLAKDLADTAYKQLTYQRNRRLFEAEAVSRDTVDSAQRLSAGAIAGRGRPRQYQAPAGEPARRPGAARLHQYRLAGGRHDRLAQC